MRPPSLSPAIPAALRFPLSPGAREWLIGFAVVAVLIQMLRAALPDPFASIVSLLGSLLLWIVVFRVASEVLLAAADGQVAMPAARTEKAPDDLAFKQISLWVLATLLLAAAAARGRLAELVVALLVLLAVLPAATLLLTLGRSMLDALYPPKWLRLAGRIGRPGYLRLIAMLAGLALGYLALTGLLVELGAPVPLRAVVGNTLWCFAVLAWFRLAGTLVYRHREALVLTPEVPAPAAPEPDFSRDFTALWNEVMNRGGTEAMHAELARQLDRRDDLPRRLEHARVHIAALLLAFDKPDAALERAAAMLEADPDFSLPDPDTMFALLRAAQQRELGWLTGGLVASYLEAFPQSVKRNEARLLACEALRDDRSRWHERAREWFGQLKAADLRAEQAERLRALANDYPDRGRTA